MRYFCWILGAIALSIGPFWYRNHVSGKEDPQAFPFSELNSEVEPAPRVPKGNGFLATTVHPPETTYTIDDFIKSYKQVQAEMPDMWSSISDQLGLALKSGQVCDAIPSDVLINDTYEVSSDQWPDPWWSWFELHGGRFICSDSGIQMNGSCRHGPFVTMLAKCALTFSRVRMRYRLRLAVLNSHLGETLTLIGAGNVSATAKDAEATLRLGRDPVDGRLHVLRLTVGRMKISKMDFENSTITWRDKKIDTSGRAFRNLVRSALAQSAEAFITGPLLDALKNAFEDTSNNRSFEKI